MEWLLAQTTVGPSNLNTTSKEELTTTFRELFSTLEKQMGHALRISNLFAGVSGGGHEKNKNDLESLLKQLVPNTTKIQVEADPLNALYSGTYGKPGIVQISGTGSITYGINHQLKACSCWGMGISIRG